LAAYSTAAQFRATAAQSTRASTPAKDNSTDDATVTTSVSHALRDCTM
jgi:hypothetical protein